MIHETERPFCRVVSLTELLYFAWVSRGNYLLRLINVRNYFPSLFSRFLVFTYLVVPVCFWPLSKRFLERFR